jgi:hypothetical protein
MSLIPDVPDDDAQPDEPVVELVPLEQLLALADTDVADILEAMLWWDQYASEDFQGALANE